MAGNKKDKNSEDQTLQKEIKDEVPNQIIISEKTDDVKELPVQQPTLVNADTNFVKAKSPSSKQVTATAQSETVKKNQTDKAPLSKGVLLEFRVKRLLFSLGYISKIGILMKTSLGENAVPITDLDVFGIYIHKDFTSKNLWVDCKSGNAKVHERISWIKGIMSTIEINDAIFVKGHVKAEVKQYARKSGIQVLDLNVLDKLEKDYNIEPDDWTGSWNYNTQYNQINKLSKIKVPSNDTYKKIANFISSDYWVMDDYSKTKKTITALKELYSATTYPIDREDITTLKWAIYELVTLLLLAILNISKEIYYFTDIEKKDSIYEGLSTGDIPNKKRAEIFDAAFRVAYSWVQNQVPEFKVPPTTPPVNLSPPKYFEAFYDLVLRITHNPLQYYDLTRFIDYLLMEYDFQSKTINHDELREKFHNYDDILNGGKTLLHFVSQTTGIPRSYFELIK